MKNFSFCKKCKGRELSSYCNSFIIFKDSCGLCLDRCNNKCVSCFLNNDYLKGLTYKDFINAGDKARDIGQRTGDEWELKIKEWLKSPQELKRTPVYSRMNKI